MRNKIIRMTSALVWIGVGLIVIGIVMWWRETRQVAVLPSAELTLASQAPAGLPAFEGAESPGDATGPTRTPRPTFTALPSQTPSPPRTSTATRTPVASATPAPTETPAGPPLAEKPPTRIVAPAIGLDAPVVPMGWEVKTDSNGNQYSEWIVPAFAAGWHINSSLPGHPGNVVLSGHHNIDGEVFRDTVNLKEGDQIILYVDDQAYEYTVVETVIVPEKDQPYEVRLRNAQYMAQTEDDRLTLVTCWPYSTNTHRAITIARPVESARPIASSQN